MNFFRASLRHTSYMQGQTSQIMCRSDFLGSCTCQVILVKCFHFAARFKGKAISLQALTGRYVSGKQAPRISRQPGHGSGKDYQPCTCRLYPAGDIPGNFWQRLSRPQGHSAAGGIKSIKKFK
jgi:hypothetical protein